MSARKPSVFIGSSSEGLSIARAVQVSLSQECDVTLWNQGFFGPGEGTLEVLVDRLPSFDFAVFVLKADDLSTVRGREVRVARDNVLLEFGICAGALGRKRTFAMYDLDARVQLPSDLAGVTLVPYRLSSGEKLQTALGGPASTISLAIVELGPRGPQFLDGAFLAVPMSAFKAADSPEAYQKFREGACLPLIDVLRQSCGMERVFCAAEEISKFEDFDLPGASLKIDMNQVRQYRFFVAFYLKDFGSKSVLVETGMALAMEKPCVICLEKGAELPFIFQSRVSAENLRIIEYGTIDELLGTMRKRCNSSWLFGDVVGL